MLTEVPFGRTPTGVPIDEYVLTTHRAQVGVIGFGATLQSVRMPDREGRADDLLLGFSSLNGYLDDPACFGATVGPVANRTDRAEVPLGGRVYHLPQNDDPDQRNNNHTSFEHGLHKRVWQLASKGNDFVLLTCAMADGELGLPGNRTFEALFRLQDTSDDVTQLTIRYSCSTDAPTYVNMTNHSYLNLAGHSRGTVDGELLSVQADDYLPLRADHVSQGVLSPVAGTPFDFREPTPVGRRIQQDDQQLERGRGYDHCLAIRGWEADAEPRPAAHVADPRSGRTMDLLVTTPGMHLYTGNWLDDTDAKDGVTYQPHSGMALEPEFYPDCCHHMEWPRPTCTPDHPYQQTIVYRFGVQD
ncbi:MAG: aldose epimerase family protein [Atopobiaceae bacterium]